MIIKSTSKFNGGGHINHSLFWANLCPANLPAASPSAAPKLKEVIEKRWGSFDEFKESFNKTLLGIQGSGWGWLVKDRHKGYLSIEITKDQDPIVGDNVPIFGVDMWEHAYYLQVSQKEDALSQYFETTLFLTVPSADEADLTSE